MPLRVGAPIPSLDGATSWLNGHITCAELRGKPTLVQFWAVSCPICKTNMPALYRWREALGRERLNFVVVHSPRHPGDEDEAEVERVACEMEMVEPCAIDSRRILAERFETGGLWPYYFLFDVHGLMKRRAAGAIGLRLVEAALRQLQQP